jgi:hypothetical protein
VTGDGDSCRAIVPVWVTRDVGEVLAIGILNRVGIVQRADDVGMLKCDSRVVAFARVPWSVEMNPNAIGDTVFPLTIDSETGSLHLVVTSGQNKNG